MKIDTYLQPKRGNIGRQDECSAKTSKVDVTNRWNCVSGASIDAMWEGGQIARILTVCNLFETRQACRFISAVDRGRVSRELNTLKPISVSATSTARVASRLLPYKYTTSSVISPSCLVYIVSIYWFLPSQKSFLVLIKIRITACNKEIPFAKY